MFTHYSAVKRTGVSGKLAYHLIAHRENGSLTVLSSRDTAAELLERLNKNVDEDVIALELQNLPTDKMLSEFQKAKEFLETEIGQHGGAVNPPAAVDDYADILGVAHFLMMLVNQSDSGIDDDDENDARFVRISKGQATALRRAAAYIAKTKRAESE